MPWKLTVGNEQSPGPGNRDTNRRKFILLGSSTQNHIDAPPSMGRLVPSLLKLRNQWNFSLLQPAAPHDAPEISRRRRAGLITPGARRRVPAHLPTAETVPSG